MKQFAYDTIVACIQHGAAAIAEPLIEELNMTVQNENKYIQELNRQEQERKAAAQNEAKVAEQKALDEQKKK